MKVKNKQTKKKTYEVNMTGSHDKEGRGPCLGKMLGKMGETATSGTWAEHRACLLYSGLQDKAPGKLSAATE